MSAAYLIKPKGMLSIATMSITSIYVKTKIAIKPFLLLSDSNNNQ